VGFGNKEEKKEDKSIHDAEFDRWAEAWEIDIDAESMTEEDRDDFRGHKAKLTNAMKRGRLVYEDETDSLKYTLAKSEGEVRIERPRGSALIAMDKYKDREGVHKTYAVLGVMTKKEPKFFSNLDGIDLKPFLSVVALFLAS
jgi:hypothetical protein